MKIFVWILLALVPFVNLQMICVDHDGASGVRVGGSSSAPDCSDFCLRAEAPPEPVQADDICVLMAGGCSLLAALVVALPERWPPLAAPMEERAAMASMPRPRYLSPALQQLTPPPKS